MKLNKEEQQALLKQIPDWKYSWDYYKTIKCCNDKKVEKIINKLYNVDCSLLNELSSILARKQFLALTSFASIYTTAGNDVLLIDDAFDSHKNTYKDVKHFYEYIRDLFVDVVSDMPKEDLRFWLPWVELISSSINRIEEYINKEEK